ncbi:MAG: esterase family protein [Bacteroidales bacterium]|nr:esterase family protein [Bacteroidales bacterium]
MKRILLAAGLLLSACSLFGRSRVVTDTLSSKILGRDVYINVYIPDGFDQAPEQTYPALYLLHGLYGTHLNWVETGGLDVVLDELIGTGEAARMVVIMPCAGDPDIHHVQNGYFNVVGNPYEDFFFSEMMPLLETKYRCGGSKGKRAISGLSMGGGGSVVYAQRHPDLFSSCYAMSAWLDQPVEDSQDPETLNDKMYITSVSVRDHSALKFVDEADEETLAALKSLKWFVDCGDDDYLLRVNTEFYFKMRAKGVPCEFRVRNGIHNWEYWHTALRLSLPFATRNFSR